MKHNFKNLNIWKNAIDLVNEIYDITAQFPKNESFGLQSQLRRAVVAIPSNIAEGSSRSSNKDFNRFLEISLGSLYEVQTQLIISNKRKYLTIEEYDGLEEKIIALQKMISGFQKTLPL